MHVMCIKHRTHTTKVPVFSPVSGAGESNRGGWGGGGANGGGLKGEASRGQMD